MLNDNIANEFKLSTNPQLQGWNLTMSIQDILNQLELSYRCPSSLVLLQNNALFRSPFCVTKAPEHLFWCIKQCQEIQVIADNPYTPMQLMANAIQLLMASGIFPMREFEDWEVTNNKSYTALKVFVHGTYAPHLVSVSLHTTGQHGCVANQHNHYIYNMLEDGALVTDDNASVAAITQQTAANDTMDSTLGNTYAALSFPTIPSPSPQAFAAVATAINQLSANQTTMWSHMQNMLLQDVALPTHVANLAVVYNQPHTAAACVPPQVQAPFQANPIHSLTIQALVHGGGFSQGRGGCGPGGQTWCCTSHGGRGPNLFGTAGWGGGTVFVPGGVIQPLYGPYAPALAPAMAQCDNTPTFLKKYNNWNVC